ncbi:MAG: hypothetical protein JNM84_04060 [Planctomycetes bacterium]|nr:hypothetical protein [Planctomycetota bacterium]
MNPSSVRRHAHHFVFALFALVVSDLWRAGTTLLPDGFLRHFHLPWARHGASRPELSNTLLSDIPWMFEAKREEARRQLAAGELPLWDPHSELGQPLLANNQCALLSPFTWPQLLLGVREAFDLSIALELLVLLYGARRLLLRLGVENPWCVVGALLLACTGMNTVWRGYPVSTALAWMPWVWLSTLELSRGGRGLFAGAVAVRALLLLSGHPESAFKLLVTDALLAVLLPSGAAAKLATVLRAGGAGLLALALSAPVTLPTLEYLSESHALALRSEMKAPERPPIEALGTLVAPWLFGSPLVRQRTEPDWAGPMNTSEIQAFVSLGVLLAAALALRRGARDGVACRLGGVALLSAAIAYELPILTPLWNAIPLLRISAPARWIFVLQAMLVLLAARGLAAEARAGRTARAVALSLLALLQALSFTRSYHPPTSNADLPGDTPELALLSSLTKLESGGRILPLGLLEPGAHLIHGLPSLRAYDAIGVRRSRQALDHFGLSAPQPELLERVAPELLAACDVRWLLLPAPLTRSRPIPGLAAPLVPQELFEVPPPSSPAFDVGLFVPGTNPRHLWLEDAHGNRAPLPLEPGCELSMAGRRVSVEDAGPARAVPRAGEICRARLVRVEPSSGSALVALRASAEQALFLAPLAPFRPEYRRVDDRLPCAVYEVLRPIGSAFALEVEPALPTALDELAVRVRTQAVERLRPQIERARLVAVRSVSEQERWVGFSRVIYPGWRARLDGRDVEIEVVAGLYPAVRVPPGEHLVEWSYEPRSLLLGALAAAAALAVLGLLSWRGLPRSRPAPNSAPEPA